MQSDAYAGQVIIVVTTDAENTLNAVADPQPLGVITGRRWWITAAARAAVFGVTRRVTAGLLRPVAATGIRVLHNVRFEGTNSALIVGVSIGLGLIPVTMPNFYQHASPGARILLDSGIATARWRR